MSNRPADERGQLLMGNQAIALGLVEAGLRVGTAYPGTPSSEILAGINALKKELGLAIHTEWSVNEKIALEVALAASWTGLRAAVAMKQVGLNVASDPLFSAAYTGVVAGLVIISADDPGPHSSQTEQDSRLLALTAKIPVLDPSTPEEARQMAAIALELSERYRLPVLLRPTTRLCHAVQSLARPAPIQQHPLKARFEKDKKRWIATPRLRYLLHCELNDKLARLEAEFETSPLNEELAAEAPGGLGIIASGVAFETAREVLDELGRKVPLLKIGTPHPLPREKVSRFIERFDQVLVLEEPDACIELQLPRRNHVRGRLDGTVPGAGELTAEVVYEILARLLQAPGTGSGLPELESLASQLSLPPGGPRLCPGCAHRSAFFVMRKVLHRAIFPGDIGCYTLGTNLRAVDTFLDMGASITMASGFFHANQALGDPRPIVATIGDSTFLHSGIPALINAVHTGARFVLLILDNATTAMTGFQPTAATESADGTASARAVSIEQLVRACGVEFLERADPYDQDGLARLLLRAHEHASSSQGGVAVLLAERPCVLYEPDSVTVKVKVEVTSQCDGCRYCLEAFECPALVLRPDGSRVDIDETLCIDCGQCLDACYKGFIVVKDSTA